MPGRQRLADRLPDFPWDLLAPYADVAAGHPLGRVDLSVGTPVDPTPEVVQAAFSAAANAPGYPTTAGTPTLREAVADWLRRTVGAEVDTAAILPTIGSKELVAQLPRLLGLAPGATVAIPEIAYPTYAVGSLLADARYVATDSPQEHDDLNLVWLNSPSNPTGRVLSAERLHEIVVWARSKGVPVVSDECYFELGWDAMPVSLLHPSVCDGSHDGLLVVHSLSKRSNLAGYRFGFVAGDPNLVSDLLAVRKHMGMIVPAPVQAAAAAAFADDAHVVVQRERYRRRREVLKAALVSAGFSIEHSEAGLYLWATRGERCWDSVAWFADRGVVVTPGDFYGPAGAGHIRVALTGTDAEIDSVPERIS